MRARSDLTDDGGESSGEIDLGALKRAVLRRKRQIVGAVLIVAALAGAYVTFVTPRYTAETQILLENQESFFTRPERTVQSDVQTAADPEAVASQVQIVASRDLALQAVRDLNLVGNPEFDPLAKGMGIATRILVALGLQRDPSRMDAEDRVLEIFQERLNVFSPTKTRVIVVDFQSKDPDLAARAANKVAELYLNLQSRAKRNVARGAAQSLAALNADLRTKLVKANADVEQFRAGAGLLAGTNNMTIAGQQLAELNSELSKARTSQADAAAKASLIRDMIKHNRVSDIPDVANNDLVRRIAEQRVTLRAQLALESRTLLPMHPRIKELNAQLGDLDVQMRAVADRTVRALENDAKIAATRVSNLEVALDTQKKSVGTANVDEIRLHELERISQAYRDQLDSTTTKYQEAVARENSASTPADARIITRAIPPQIPSYPKKIPILAFATIATVVAAVGLVISAELLGGRPYRDARPLEAPAPVATRTPQVMTRLKAFGRSAKAEAAVTDVAPTLKDATPGKPEEAPVAEPPPALHVELPAKEADETAAEIATHILAERQTGRATRIVATNLGDAQAIEAVVIALGRRLADNGRAILIDVEGTGNAAVDGLLGPAGRQAGLADLLDGTASFAEVIHRDLNSRLHIVPSAKTPLTASDDFALALDALSETYDFILMLTGSISESARAYTLAPIADAMLILSHQDASDLAVASAHAHFVEAGAGNVLVVTLPQGSVRQDVA